MGIYNRDLSFSNICYLGKGGLLCHEIITEDIEVEDTVMVAMADMVVADLIHLVIHF